MAGRLRRVQQRDAGSYYREMQQRDAGSCYREMRSIAAKAAMPHLPSVLIYIGARARVRHAHARICKSNYRVINKNDRQQTSIKIRDFAVSTVVYLKTAQSAIEVLPF